MSAVHCSSASTEGNSYAQSDLDSNLTPVVDTIGNNECQRYDNSTTKRKFCWPKFDRKRSEKIAIFFLMCLHYLVISIAFSIIGPFFPVKASSKGISSLVIGLIAGICPLIVAILSPVFGYFQSIIGIRFGIVSGTALMAGSIVLIGFSIDIPNSTDFVILSFIIRIVEGVGIAMALTSTLTYITMLFPSSTGTAMGVMELSSGMGYLIGPPAGGVLDEIGGFKLLFTVAGAVIFTTMFILMFTLTNTEMNKAKEVSVSFKTAGKILFSFPSFSIMLSNLLSMAAVGFFVPTFAPFLVQTFHLNSIQIGLVFTLAPLLYLLASVVAGKLADIMGPTKCMSCGLCIAALGYLVVGPAPFITSNSNLFVTITGYSISGVGMAMGLVPAMAGMLEIAKNLGHDSLVMKGVISGIVSSTRSFGECIGPLIGGGLYGAFGFQTATMIYSEILASQGILLLGMAIVDLIFIKWRKNKYSSIKLMK